jgi:hypothetical protein
MTENTTVITEIKKLCHKSPHYSNHFIKMVNENNIYYSIDEINRVYQKIVKYKNLLKNKKFNHTNYKDLEVMEDEIDAIIEKNQVELMIKEVASNRYKFLFDEKVKTLFQECVRKKISKSVIQQFIGKKIARYNHPSELYKALEKLVIELSDYSKTAILEKIDNKSLSVDVLFNADNILVVSVYDYEACKNLGSGSWCIVTSESYFNRYIGINDNYNIQNSEYYLELRNRQIIIFDFDRSPGDVYSMVGMTLDENGITTAHLKDDSRCLNIQEYCKVIGFNYKEHIIEDYEILSIIKQKKSDLNDNKRMIIVNRYVKDTNIVNQCFGKMFKKQKKVTDFNIKFYLSAMLDYRKYENVNDYWYVFNFYEKYLKPISFSTDTTFKKNTYIFLVNSLMNKKDDYAEEKVIDIISKLSKKGINLKEAVKDIDIKELEKTDVPGSKNAQKHIYRMVKFLLTGEGYEKKTKRYILDIFLKSKNYHLFNYILKSDEAYQKELIKYLRNNSMPENDIFVNRIFLNNLFLWNDDLKETINILKNQLTVKMMSGILDQANDVSAKFNNNVVMKNLLICKEAFSEINIIDFFIKNKTMHIVDIMSLIDKGKLNIIFSNNEKKVIVKMVFKSSITDPIVIDFIKKNFNKKEISDIIMNDNSAFSNL